MQFDTNELISFMTNWSVILPALATTILMAILAQVLGIALGLSPRAVGVQENVSDGLEALRARNIV